MSVTDEKLAEIQAKAIRNPRSADFWDIPRLIAALSASREEVERLRGEVRRLDTECNLRMMAAERDQ